MTLRSRKGGLKSKKEREDEKLELEGAHLNNFKRGASQNLRTLETQTYAFNLLWKKMLMRLSGLLIMYSLVVVGMVLQNSSKFMDQEMMMQDEETLAVVGYHLSAILVFGGTYQWMSTTNEIGFGPSVNTWYVGVLCLIFCEVAFFAWARDQRPDWTSHRLFPVTALYFVICNACLGYMRRTSLQAREARSEFQKATGIH